MKHLRVILYLILIPIICAAQDNSTQVKLTLSEAIRCAAQSSLSSKGYAMQYLTSYWSYRYYKASRKPSLSLHTNPVSYYRYLTKRYDSQNDIDIFREQKSWQSSGALSITQAFTPIGGVFYVESDLEFLRNFGSSTYNQFSTIPVRIGYTHSLLGYNEYKWEKRIEPQRYEVAMKEYIYNHEQLSINVASLFFQVAQCKMQCDLAEKQLASADTLYSIGKKRYDLALLTKQSLLSLKLDIVNSKKNLASAKSNLSRAVFQLATLIGIPTNTNIEADLSETPFLPEINSSKAIELMRANGYNWAKQEQTILQAEQNLDKTNKQSRFKASLTASVGFNQQSDNLSKSWKDPLRQDIISLDISIPLIDWGQGKGQRQIAKTNLTLTQIQTQQSREQQEQELLLLIEDLDLSYNFISSSYEAMKIAEESYAEAIRLFIAGASDIASLSIAESKQSSAVTAYVNSLAQFWNNYFKLRSLTLYDWQLDIPLIDVVDFDSIVTH
ncbi:MAG: TolC family protein [Bacteroidales bacterium]|nr:TolC family protein [Bacteroidales bacterium]